MPRKNTYTLRIQYDKKTAFKAMVDDDNNWKSLDVHPSEARRRRIARILKEVQTVGELKGRDMPMTPAMNWYPARFAIAVQRHYDDSEMLDFTGEPSPMSFSKQGVIY